MRGSGRLPVWVRDGMAVAAGAALGLAVAVVLLTGGGEAEGPKETIAAPPPVAETVSPAPRPVEPATVSVTPKSPTQDRTETEQPAWVRFAAPAPATAGRALIAVVLDDLGIDQRRSARALALPAPLTTAFLPYARELPAQIRAARRAGHELLVHLSMEPERASADPGPNALNTRHSDGEIKRLLNWALRRFKGYVGASNHMGSRFTADGARMEVVLLALKRRGLLYLDSRTTLHSVAGALARRIGLPYAARDVFLDDDAGADAATVARRLKQVERIARRTGAAIAIGHPRDATLSALEDWLPTLAGRGFALVPVSTIVARRDVPG